MIPQHLLDELALRQHPDYGYTNEFNFFYFKLVKDKRKYSPMRISSLTGMERDILETTKNYSYAEALYVVLQRYNKLPKLTRRHYDNQN
jgi:hypothetical protein